MNIQRMEHLVVHYLYYSYHTHKEDHFDQQESSNIVKSTSSLVVHAVYT